MTQNHSDRMRRLVAAGLLPERAGQPVKTWVHISLADLLLLDGSSALQEEWTAAVRALWTGHRAAASAGGGDGGAWLDGDAAAAMTCDAAMAPVVTGDVNPAALEDLVRLCVQLDKLRHHPGGGDTGGDRQDAPAPDTTRAWEALEQAVIGKAVDLLSGPGGAGGVLAPPPAGGAAGHHHRLEPGQDQGPAQPQPARPAGVTPPWAARASQAHHMNPPIPADRVTPSTATGQASPTAPDEHPPPTRLRCHLVLSAFETTSR